MRHNQNRRSRGRSRKGPNPLTRSFESNGPDVKVRGTAAHVADKYMTLARDAHAAGDTVSAENYLQHAEHYNRIVMAAQAQFQPQQPQFREGSEEGYDDDRQANGRVRDRFDYNGDGRGEGDGEPYEGRESDDRAYQPGRRPDDQQQRQRGPRPDRYEARDRPERNDRNDRHEQREAGDPANGPQPAVPAPAASIAAEEAPSPPRRRRGRGKPDESAEAPDETSDGAAALAAFPE